MADNSSSSVASVAIVIIVILAVLAVGYFVMYGKSKPTESTKIEVSVPEKDSAPSNP